MNPYGSLNSRSPQSVSVSPSTQIDAVREPFYAKNLQPSRLIFWSLVELCDFDGELAEQGRSLALMNYAVGTRRD